MTRKEKSRLKLIKKLKTAKKKNMINNIINALEGDLEDDPADGPTVKTNLKGYTSWHYVIDDDPPHYNHTDAFKTVSKI